MEYNNLNKNYLKSMSLIILLEIIFKQNKILGFLKT